MSAVTTPTFKTVVFKGYASAPPVVPIPTLPLESIESLVDPAVKNSSTSSSAPAEDSALINVSPSTSFTPPREPHDSPAPKPSNCESWVLYLTWPKVTAIPETVLWAVFPAGTWI